MEMKVKFNDQDYIAKYNKQSGYYELELTADADKGGIYQADITFTDLFGEQSTAVQMIQVLARQNEIKLESNKIFMWIFDYKDFSVKDIVELSDYEINIDEETNANTSIKIIKKTNAKSRDIIAIKKNNKVIYWGVIDNIQNENGKKLYEYTVKYITNIFDRKIPIAKNVENDKIEDGVYVIKTAIDTNKVLDVYAGSKEDEANIQIWNSKYSENQKWRITKDTNDDTYEIRSINSDKVLDVYGPTYQNGTNIQQYRAKNSDNQKFFIQHLEKSYYTIKTKASNFFIDVYNSNVTEGTNVIIYQPHGRKNQQFLFERLDEEIIKDIGIEDFIAKAINENFINSEDTFINKNYLEVRVKTHTKLQVKVSNVEENIYNLHTWMSNCTQLYNITYNFFIEGKKFILEIENKTYTKELIDVKAQPISNYTEIFGTDVVSKVEVLTDTDTYVLYLLNDRTTTTDMGNENRAEGKIETCYTQKYEDAEQKALDIIKSNSYNHNITFDYYDRYLKVGTPIAIKTKESLIHDTYISSIQITPKKFIKYQCGNIRINFIEKIKKERKK